MTSSCSLAQRRGFREYLTGLLAPRDRNKTITCLAGAEPVVGASGPGVQRLQFFPVRADRVNGWRLELLWMQVATAPHKGGVIVIDNSGDRKDGTATAHVGREWLGRLGKTDSGIITVTTVWTDGRIYYPLHAQPYIPAHHFSRGRVDPGFRTNLLSVYSFSGTQDSALDMAIDRVADVFLGEEGIAAGGWHSQEARDYSPCSALT